MAAVTLPLCPGPLSPVCSTVGGAGSGIVGAGASAVLSAISGWVVTGASWLLDQIGSVMSTSTRVDVTAGWFTAHYTVMAGIGAAVALPMLLVGGIQAVYRQSPAVLVRSALVHLPLAAVLTAAAVQLVQLSLAATDALCATVSAGTGGSVDRVLSGLGNALATQAAGGPYSAPMFVVMLGALVVAAGALVLWLELLVRASAVYVAVLFLPLGLASLVWPAVTHWCRRLVDTLVALVLSKFVMVAILSLASGALATGTSAGFSAVLAGGALLLLAAFAPFALLRLVPTVEAGAVHQLEGARQRVRHAAGSLPGSAAAHVLRGVQEGRQPALDPGEPGTVGADVATGVAGALGAGAGALGGGRGPGHRAASGTGGAAGRRGPGSPGAPGDPPGSGGVRDGGNGVPELPGQPATDAAFWEVVRSPRPPPGPLRGTGGALPGATGAPLWSHDGPAGGPGDTLDDASGECWLGDLGDATDWDGGWSDGGWDGSSGGGGRGPRSAGADSQGAAAGGPVGGG